MVENQPQPEQEQPKRVPKQRRILRSILLSVLFSIIFLLSVLAVLFSTNQGSKFLLEQVMQRQQIIHYEYEGGNLWRSEEHTSELQSRENLVCRLLLEKKKKHIKW